MVFPKKAMFLLDLLFDLTLLVFIIKKVVHRFSSTVIKPKVLYTL